MIEKDALIGQRCVIIACDRLGLVVTLTYGRVTTLRSTRSDDRCVMQLINDVNQSLLRTSFFAMRKCDSARDATGLSIAEQ